MKHSTCRQNRFMANRPERVTVGKFHSDELQDEKMLLSVRNRQSPFRILSWASYAVYRTLAQIHRIIVGGSYCENGFRSLRAAIRGILGRSGDDRGPHHGGDIWRAVSETCRPYQCHWIDSKHHCYILSPVR